jgi:hypothetical protein
MKGRVALNFHRFIQRGEKGDQPTIFVSLEIETSPAVIRYNKEGCLPFSVSMDIPYKHRKGAARTVERGR